MNHNSLSSAMPGKHTAAVDFGIAAAGLVRFANTGKARPAADEQPQMSGANNHPARALKEKIQFRQLMRSVRTINWLWVVVMMSLAPASWAGAPSAPKPNIVYILADDLGYGDVQCYNPQRGKIPTPNLDRLAADGMRFTDAHTGSSVCTPTRYSVLTGRYAWRTHLQSGVLNGFSAPLIAQDRTTVASLLKANGYQTACIGKWHLGLHWQNQDVSDSANQEQNPQPKSKQPNVDWTKPILNGPTTLGFDYFYGIAASLDMPPFVFIENDRVTAIPTTEKKWGRAGPAAENFEAEAVMPELTRKAANWIEQRAATQKPFFLYLAYSAPHTPILPTKEWQGKSGLNPYADFMMQTDAAVGELLATLNRTGLATNTLVIFTSDNGCSPAAGLGALQSKGHHPSGPWRGAKADIWEGGHRVPFIVRWPGRVKAGTTSDETICLSDLLATSAALVGAKLPDNAGEDSVSFLPALLGEKRTRPLREATVHHSIDGRFAIRQGDWKLALCSGSGGWSAPRDQATTAKNFPSVQLYNLAADPGETNNLHATHPEVVARLTGLLEKYVAAGRSTPGAKQSNDVPVKITKSAGKQ
jgi:arylsulfatase A